MSQCDIGGSRMQAWNPSAQLTGELRNLGYSNPRQGEVSCIVDPSLSHPALEEGSATRSVRRYLPIVKEGLRTARGKRIHDDRADTCNEIAHAEQTSSTGKRWMQSVEG